MSFEEDGRRRLTPPLDVFPPFEQAVKVVASNDASLPAGTTGTMTTRFVVGKDGRMGIVQSFRRDESRGDA